MLGWAFWSSDNKGGKTMEYQFEQELGFEYDIEQEEGEGPETTTTTFSPSINGKPPDYFLGSFLIEHNRNNAT